MPAALPPDDSQQRILDAYDEGTLSIVAVPGSGKTTMLINLACDLIRSGRPAEKILLVTFTEKAAAQLARRLEDTLIERGLVSSIEKRPTVSTLHSLGGQILTDRVNPLYMGLPFDPMLWDEPLQINSIIGICIDLVDRLEQIELPEDLPDLNPQEWQRLAQDLLAAIAHSRELHLSPKAVRKLARRTEGRARDHRLLHEFALIFCEYEAQKRAYGAIDFNDQMLLPLQLLESDSIAERWQTSFDFVVEDESQDSSRAQYEFVNKIAERSGNLVRVGDPLQSIYAWRDAYVDGIHRHHEQSDHRHVLQLNYRSATQIIDFANHWKRRWASDSLVIKPRTQAPAGKVVRRRFTNEQAEADWIARTIHRVLSDAPRTSVAVLARSRSKLGPIARALRSHQIFHHTPQMGGFFQSARIQHWYAFFGLVDTLLTTPFGPAMAETAVRHLQQLLEMRLGSEGGKRPNLGVLSRYTTPSDFMDAVARLCESCPPDVGTAVAQIKADVVEVVRHMLAGDGTMTQRILAAIVSLQEPEDVEQRNFLTKLAALTRDLEEASGELTLSDWLQWLLTQVNFSRETPPQPLDVEQPGVVVLSTIHGAKGLEWDAVFYPGVWGPETVWDRLGTRLRICIDYTSQVLEPSDVWRRENEITTAESCRLAYVAITRARNQLYLSAVKNSQFWEAVERWESD